MTIEIFKKLKQTNYLPDWFLINQDLILPSNLRKVYYQIITLDNQRRQDKSKLDQFSFSNSIKNTHLNRYSDICAYDYNRVILNHQLDYINASWLTSLGNQTKYIAAQGPLKSSFADFWQMVWEQSVNLIVMLTPEEEKGRIKCHHYWPFKVGESEKYKKGDSENLMSFEVLFNSEESVLNGKAFLRNFTLKYIDQTKVVQMLHFLDWEDHEGSDPRSILELIDLSNQINNESGIPSPMIVHCSAGVGRTGTFCTIDSVLKALQNGSCKTMNDPALDIGKEWELLPKDDLIARMVNNFRWQRNSSVQSESQFLLCYDAVLLKLEDWANQKVPKTW